MVTDRSPTESIAGVDALTCPLAAPLRDLTRSNMEALGKVSSNFPTSATAHHIRASPAKSGKLNLRQSI